MVYYIYSRVSHKSSADSGLSIEEQIAQSMAYARDRLPGIALGEVSFEDAPGVFCDRAISGWSRAFHKRPAGSMLDGILKEGDHVVCYSIDRLARNVRDFCNTTFDLDSRGIHVHYICEQIDTSTALGKLQAHYRAAAAQYMSDQISERTKEAKLISSITGKSRSDKSCKRRTWVQSDFNWGRSAPVATRKTGTIYMYERVSTNAQYTSGLGLESQSRRNRDYATRLAAAQGSILHEETFSDPAESAFRSPLSKRPAGSRMLAMLKPGDDIVIYKLDRAWRDTIEALTMIKDLTERGIYVHLVHEGIRTDMPQGTEWIGFLAAMAQLESTYRSRRVREAFARCRAQGRPIGRIPAGLKPITVNGKTKLIPDVKVITEIARTWVLFEMLEMSHMEIDAIKFAFFCSKKKCRPVQKYRKQMRPDRDMERANRIRMFLPEALWFKCVAAACEQIAQGVDAQYIPTDCQWPSRDLLVERGILSIAV